MTDVLLDRNINYVFNEDDIICTVDRSTEAEDISSTVLVAETICPQVEFTLTEARSPGNFIQECLDDAGTVVDCTGDDWYTWRMRISTSIVYPGDGLEKAGTYSLMLQAKYTGEEYDYTESPYTFDVTLIDPCQDVTLEFTEEYLSLLPGLYPLLTYVIGETGWVAGEGEGEEYYVFGPWSETFGDLRMVDEVSNCEVCGESDEVPETDVCDALTE